MRFQTCDSAGISVSELPRALLRSSLRLVLKRWVDILAGLFFIVLCSPFFLILALLVRIQVRGPILEPFECVGLHGERFRMWRFKTSRKRPVAGVLGLETDSSRRTWIVFGRTFRATSLDRLPLLVNLVKGQMSLIGPTRFLPRGGRNYNVGTNSSAFRCARESPVSGNCRVSDRSPAQSGRRLTCPIFPRGRSRSIC